MADKWMTELEALYDEMVVWRRHMHQHPELSFHEVETPAFIVEKLESFGVEVRTHVGGRGVVGLIKGGKPGNTIALRADFDGLPIQDEKETPYKSLVPGVMHACGHDGHTATLLAVAKVLSENRAELAGNVVLLHQHAEEVVPGGAIAMIEDGCLDGVDVVYGTHLISGIPYGKYGYRKGNLMAAADMVEIKIQGRGGHGASPHETIDSIAIGAQIVNQLQLLVSRQVDPLQPAVVTIGSFHAGNAHNIIADSASMVGTVRTFDEGVRDHLEKEIKNIVEGVCSAFHAKGEVIYTRGYPAVKNHEKETDVFLEVVQNYLDPEMAFEVPPQMGGEDFAYYLKEKPGIFFYTGAGNSEIGADYPHHHPKFDFDERAMVNAGKAFLGLVHYYLVGNETSEDTSNEARLVDIDS
jgi:amidohydrolase